jgi:hypothetical protein
MKMMRILKMVSTSGQMIVTLPTQLPILNSSEKLDKKRVQVLTLESSQREGRYSGLAIGKMGNTTRLRRMNLPLI